MYILVMAHARHGLNDHIIQQKYIETQKIQWIFYLTSMTVNDTIHLLRIKLL
jgi:hypothetical protein